MLVGLEAERGKEVVDCFLVFVGKAYSPKQAPSGTD